MDTSEGTAIPFITFQERKGYVLTEQAEKFLNSLSDTKLGVLTVVGKYRTGKSFFINRVLLNQKKSGFSVGPTINPCTKGLWLWSKTLKAENSEEDDMSVLLIDTEGFGGIDEHTNHDTKIFLFALLLSSFFIYNSVGSIDENALNNLSLIVNLAKDIQFKASGSNPSESDDVSQFFPSFLWIIRDFALRLVDGANNPITPKEYLESALQPQKGVSDSIESKNRVRRLLKHFFRDRDCATMVRPVENEKELQRLDEMDESSFRTEFVEQLKAIRKKIFKKVKPKTLNGKCLTGPMLVEICKAYAETINSGKVPNIESAWTYLCQQQSYKALTESVNVIDNELGNVGKEPLTIEQMKKLKTKLREGVIAELKKKSMGTEAEVKELVSGLEAKLKEKLSQFKEENIQKWRASYSLWLEQKYEEIEEKVKTDEYNNFFEFQRAFEGLKESYEKEAPEGPCKAACLKEFAEKALIRAAEFLMKKQEQQFQHETRRINARLEMTESQLSNKSKEVEEERKNLFQKIQEIEKEKATTSAEKQTLKYQLEEFQREKERMERKYNELSEEYRNVKAKYGKISEEELAELKNKLQKVQAESLQKESEYQKSEALLNQELTFTRRETESLQKKVDMLEEENRRLRVESAEAQKMIEGLKDKMSQSELSKQQEINGLKLELERKMMDLANETDKRKDGVKNQSEWMIEKSYLENQVNFLKSQLEENKRLHNALLMALEQGKFNSESEASSELVETNRHLSAAVDKMEARCKVLEEKLEKAKQYKRMVKNSNALQCAHCAKFISTNIFSQHITNCAGTSHNSSQIMNQRTQFFNGFSNFGPQSAATSFNNVGANTLNSTLHITQPIPNSLQGASDSYSNYCPIQISINQTMVKESSDNKPYTEYLIQVSCNGNKWSVSRKYKMFCELHQTLTSAFPNLKFPDSNFTGLSSFMSASQNTTSKRPTVIEERRKALQQYLRDMAKIDVIRNNQTFRKFLELDRSSESTGEPEKIRTMANELNHLANFMKDKSGLRNDLQEDYFNQERGGMNGMNKENKFASARYAGEHEGFGVIYKPHLKDETNLPSQDGSMNPDQAIDRNNGSKNMMHEIAKTTSHSRSSSTSMTNGSDQNQLYSNSFVNTKNSGNSYNPKFTPESLKNISQKNYKTLKSTAISNSPSSPHKYLVKANLDRGAGTIKDSQRENSSLNNSRNLTSNNYVFKY